VAWWGAWGPAIGVGDGVQWVALPHYTPKKSRKIFSSGKRNVKFGHFVNISYIISGKNVLPPPNLTELLGLPYAYGLVLPGSVGGKL